MSLRAEMDIRRRVERYKVLRGEFGQSQMMVDAKLNELLWVLRELKQ